MGQRISALFADATPKPKRRILMVGLDSAGKTTILYKLKLAEVTTIIPTIGFNVEVMDAKSIAITCWDVGGKDKIRTLWRHYYQNTDAVVFVVDSTDRDRILDAGYELCKMLQEDELRDVPLLVFANKQDVPGAMSAEEITDHLDMWQIRERRWDVRACHAATGDGIHDGFDWLCRACDPAEPYQDKIPPPLVDEPGSYLVAAGWIDIHEKLDDHRGPFKYVGKVAKGQYIEVADIVQHRNNTVYARVEKPQAGFVTLHRHSIEMNPLVVTVSADMQPDGGIAFSCTSMVGEEIANFEVANPDQQTLGELRHEIAERSGYLAQRLHLILASGESVGPHFDAEPVASVFKADPAGSINE